MKPTLSIIIAAWLAAIVILSLVSCNPVKQVLKSEFKTRQVVDSFIKKYPFKNDTTIKYLPGKTDTTTKYIPYRDSIDKVVPCDSFTIKTPQGTTVSVDKYRKLKIINNSLSREINTHRTDTIQRDVVDRSLLLAAQDLVRKQSSEIAALKLVLREKENLITKQNREIFWLKVKMYGLLTLLVLSIIYNIYRFFRPRTL